MKIFEKIGIIMLACMTFSTYSRAQVSLSISLTANLAPPEIPVYTQPDCPTDGYIWSPGYWSYGDEGYYWVPGVWVSPPRPGFLWTPGYWGYAGGVYGWHGGYWGRHVGFYGGVNYGYGYCGSGFYGGRWEGNSFRYNTAVVSVNTTVVHNTYIDRTVIVNNTTVNRTSFNGEGGLNVRPNDREQIAMNEQHVQATSEQLSHEHTASQDRSQFASQNHGRPSTAAMNSVGGDRFSSEGHMRNGSQPSASVQVQGLPKNGQPVNQVANGARQGGGHPNGAHPAGAHPYGQHPGGGHPGGGHPGGAHPGGHRDDHR